MPTCRLGTCGSLCDRGEGTGRMAYCEDTEGNLFGIIEYDSPLDR
jgi:hypothetical protein